MLKTNFFLPQICFDGQEPPGSPPPSQPWYHGADPETIGYFQNRGLADKSPAEVAIAVAKSHREAEKLIGVPAAQVVRLPTDPNDAAAWASVWQRLGAPKDAKDYDFSTVKRAGDQPLDAAFEQSMRTTLAAAGIPKSMASQVLSGLVKHMDGVEQATVAEKTAALNEERKALEKDWGANYALNKTIAGNAARAIGLNPEIISALEQVAGYKSVMQAMLNLGAKIGEAPFRGGDGQQPGTMSREMAIARKGELMADKDWSKRYLSGGAAEKREMGALLALITGSEQ